MKRSVLYIHLGRCRRARRSSQTVCPSEFYPRGRGGGGDCDDAESLPGADSENDEQAGDEKAKDTHAVWTKLGADPEIGAQRFLF